MQAAQAAQAVQAVQAAQAAQAAQTAQAAQAVQAVPCACVLCVRYGGGTTAATTSAMAYLQKADEHPVLAILGGHTPFVSTQLTDPV